MHNIICIDHDDHAVILSSSTSRTWPAGCYEYSFILVFNALFFVGGCETTTATVLGNPRETGVS